MSQNFWAKREIFRCHFVTKDITSPHPIKKTLIKIGFILDLEKKVNRYFLLFFSSQALTPLPSL